MSWVLRGILGTALAILLTACASAPPKRQETPVFFPPAPELPRFQYLTSFSSLQDVEEQSAFNRFVVGQKQDVKLDKPYGLAIHDWKIYVCDTNSTVIIFDLRNKTFAPMKGAVGPGKLIQPTNIFIEKDGTKYVADPLRGQIVAFDRDDGYLRAYGEPGGWRPVDVVAYEDKLYVADIANGLIKVFDKQTGEVLKTLGGGGDPSERLDRPTNLALDAQGYLYVTDLGRFQVVKLDRDGHFKTAFGSLGDGPGHFARPKGISLDREGHLYVVDAAFSNVQIFNPEGRILMFFGGSGDQPGNFILPAKVAIDYDNVSYFQQFAQPDFQIDYLVLVTSQFGPRLVNVLASGRERGKRYPTDAELLNQIEERRQEKEKSQKP
jgi:DNA-binding beta-propeller fold protein YncE